MKIAITGGCGFVGQWLTKKLIDQGEFKLDGQLQKIEKILLIDQVRPSKLLKGLEGLVEIIESDLASIAPIFKEHKPDVTFHLASVMSGEGEQDFKKAIKVNLDGTRLVLDTLMELSNGKSPLVIFTSTTAVFGPEKVISDADKQIPLTTYGATKAMNELFINDLSRRGLIDGRIARLPTVMVRPGSNSAASSFCSSVISDTLQGKDSVVPVSADQKMIVSSYRCICDGIVALAQLDAKLLGQDRAVGLPALTVTAKEIVECTNRLRETRSNMGNVIEKVDPQVAAICANWPEEVDAKRAIELNLPIPSSIDQIAKEYISDYIDN